MTALSSEPFPNYWHLCPFPVAKGGGLGVRMKFHDFVSCFWRTRIMAKYALGRVFFRQWLPFMHAIYLLVKCGYFHCVVRACWQLYISGTLENSVGSTRLVWANCVKFPLEALRVSQLLQKLSSFLWNPNVHCCIYGSPTLLPVLSQINPGHSVLVYFFKVHFNTIFPSTSRSS